MSQLKSYHISSSKKKFVKAWYNDSFMSLRHLFRSPVVVANVTDHTTIFNGPQRFVLEFYI